MTLLSRISVCLLASAAFVVGPSQQAIHAETVVNEVMLINAKTGKCLTIAGGVSTDNNVESVHQQRCRHKQRV
jgi:hypothetical protein